MDFKYLIEKFTSRKFIAMLTSVITSILTYLGRDNLIVQVVSLISSLVLCLLTSSLRFN